MDTKRAPMRKKLFLMLQYWWRLAIPLWLFRDANKGTPEQRIANYRYNRSLRNILPFYMLKWVGIAFCMIMLTRVLSELMMRTVAGSADHICATMFCMSAGIGFAFSCVVLTVLMASYLFLTYIKR